MGTSRRRLSAALAMALCLVAPTLAAAQSKLTRIVVAFPAGGPIDIVARLIAEPMAKELGNPVIVENRPGGNTVIGAQYVASSPGDGSVIFLASMSTVILNPLLQEKLPYDADKDFAPISFVAVSIPVLAVNASHPAKDAAEFAAAAKTAANPVPIGSAGVGGTTHISIELFAGATGAKLLHVPYKGAAPAINDVLGNQVVGFFGDLPGVISHIRGGRMKALAILSSERHPLIPDVKTTAELGIKGVENENWYGMIAPSKTPPELIARLNKAVHAALNDPSTRAKLVETGALVRPSTPEDLAKTIKADREKMGALIKARNIKLE